MSGNAKLMPLWMIGPVAIGLFCSSQVLGAKPSPYTLVALDTRDGFARGLVHDVEIVDGTITCVGYLDETDGDKAVMWQVTPTGTGFNVAPSYLADGESAHAVNAKGEAVGQRMELDSDGQVPVRQGLYWPNPGGSPIPLAPLPGGNETEPFGINSAGVIVGCSTYVYETTDAEGNVSRHSDPTAVVWRSDLADVDGWLVPAALNGQTGAFTVAYGVNESDAAAFAQVVGIAVEGRPVVWQLDCVTLASTGPALLVPGNVAAGGAAEAVNDAGDICGRYDMLAFRRQADGTFEQLSTPRGGTSIANDINDRRQVVGRVWVWNKSGGLRSTYGVMWQSNGKRVELNGFLGRSGWRHIHEGRAIGADGVIAATGVLNEDHESRALLMIPKE